MTGLYGIPDGLSIDRVRSYLRPLSYRPSPGQWIAAVSLDRNVFAGVVTRRDLLEPDVAVGETLASVVRRSPKFVYEDATARQAADHMVNHGIGRLPVLRRGKPPVVVGMVKRSDILSVFQRHVDDAQRQAPSIRWRWATTR